MHRPIITRSSPDIYYHQSLTRLARERTSHERHPDFGWVVVVDAQSSVATNAAPGGGSAQPQHMAHRQSNQLAPRQRHHLPPHHHQRASERWDDSRSSASSKGGRSAVWQPRPSISSRGPGSTAAVLATSWYRIKEVAGTIDHAAQQPTLSACQQRPA
jgi:hypothetical protein